jgi:hypothetical protein
VRWHYTIGKCLESILQDGFLKPATANMWPGERPIVWFTTSPEWEQIANKSRIDTMTGISITLTREETEKDGRGLFRIGVPDNFPLKRFKRITRETRQEPSITKAFIAIALEAGSNPHRDWWGTFKPVSWFDWKELDSFTPNGWQQFIELKQILNRVGKVL